MLVHLLKTSLNSSWKTVSVVFASVYTYTFTYVIYRNISIPYIFALCSRFKVCFNLLSAFVSSYSINMVFTYIGTVLNAPNSHWGPVHHYVFRCESESEWLCPYNQVTSY